MADFYKYVRGVNRLWLSIRYPLFIGILLGLLVGVVIIIRNQGAAQTKADTESRVRQEQLQGLLKEIQRSSDETNNHLDCILEYFSRRSRSGLFLEDIDKCRYERRIDPQATAPEQDRPQASARKTPRPTPRKPTARSNPAPRPIPRPAPTPQQKKGVERACSNLQKLLHLPSVRKLCK